MEHYAYVRVSTKEQNIDRQKIALEVYQIPEQNIYCDYQSGKNFERPEYQKMIKKLKPGDLVVIKSIDRLGRNYNEILTQWQYITKQLKADILVLDMEILDTHKQNVNLLVRGRQKGLLQQKEREENLVDRSWKFQINLK